MLIECGGDGNAVPLLRRQNLLCPSHLGVPCNMGNAFYISTGDSVHYPGGALCLSRFLTGQIAVLTKGQGSSLQEMIYLSFVGELVKGLLLFSKLSGSVTILLTKLIILSRTVWLRRRGYKLRFLQHGVPYFHQYASGVRSEAGIPDVNPWPFVSSRGIPISSGFSLS